MTLERKGKKIDQWNPQILEIVGQWCYCVATGCVYSEEKQGETALGRFVETALVCMNV